MALPCPLPVCATAPPAASENPPRSVPLILACPRTESARLCPCRPALAKGNPPSRGPMRVPPVRPQLLATVSLSGPCCCFSVAAARGALVDRRRVHRSTPDLCPRLLSLSATLLLLSTTHQSVRHVCSDAASTPFPSAAVARRRRRRARCPSPCSRSHAVSRQAAQVARRTQPYYPLLSSSNTCCQISAPTAP